LTDFDEIWHGDADWPNTGGQTVKISYFLKTKMAVAAVVILKISTITISPQKFDLSLRNLARLCNIGLLTVLVVKKFEFPKSKMADGRHFKNR